MKTKQVYPPLLMLLTVASFFHMQAVVMGIAAILIFAPLKKHLRVIANIGPFVILIVPALIAIIPGSGNDTYLILKDLYYFCMPLIFILSGITLACRLSIPVFLKTLVWAGTATAVMVTAISVIYVGPGVLLDPYSGHYAIGIVGTPGAPLALACLLLSKKFNIKLFHQKQFLLLTAINAFGVYMFASRTYFVVTLCFLVLLLTDKIRRIWVLPVAVLLLAFIQFFPLDAFKSNSSGTFMTKITNSFSEMSIGDYSTEQDINMKYRGYESFMALQTFAGGTTAEMTFGSLGKLVDLKTFVRLGEDTEYRYIPVLHNGWIYILVKTGFLGVGVYLLLYIGLIVYLWKYYADNKGKPIIRLFAAIIIGSVLSLLFTNYVVSAFFNVEMSILMVSMGYAFFNYRSLLFTLKRREQVTPIYYNDLEAA